MSFALGLAAADLLLTSCGSSLTAASHGVTVTRSTQREILSVFVASKRADHELLPTDKVRAGTTLKSPGPVIALDAPRREFFAIAHFDLVGAASL